MDKKFNYTYSAPTESERMEIESIKNQYIQKSPHEEKYIKIKKLDNIVKNVPTCVSLIVSIAGLLVFGLGFTLILEWNKLILGIGICLVGVVLMIVAYPLYTKTLAILKHKYGEQIIKLSEELLNENNE